MGRNIISDDVTVRCGPKGQRRKYVEKICEHYVTLEGKKTVGCRKKFKVDKSSAPRVRFCVVCSRRSKLDYHKVYNRNYRSKKKDADNLASRCQNNYIALSYNGKRKPKDSPFKRPRPAII